jgi:hypothetical protein
MMVFTSTLHVGSKKAKENKYQEASIYARIWVKMSKFRDNLRV